MSTDPKALMMAAIAATPAPTRGDARRRGVGVLVASLAVAGLIFAAAGGPVGVGLRPWGVTAGLAGGWALFCALLTWFVVARRSSTLGRRPVVILAAALAT